jgi:hypothetical protein
MRGEFRSSEDAGTADRASNTDTKSDVLVAVSQGRYRLATHSATDQRLRSAENVFNFQPAKEEGGGAVIGREGLLADPISDTENFHQMRLRSCEALLV